VKRAWLAVLVCACGRDIRLGALLDALPDAPADGALHLPWIAGSYAITFVDPSQISCSNSLSGHESDFMSTTRAAAGFVDGTVQLDDASGNLVISGASISTAFGEASVTLVPDPGAQPPTLWDVAVTVSFGGGPDATTGEGVGLALDSATATAASGIQGEVARIYVTAAGDGQCSVMFGALLVSN
jgi:hypothetical protein